VCVLAHVDWLHAAADSLTGRPDALVRLESLGFSGDGDRALMTLFENECDVSLSRSMNSLEHATSWMSFADNVSQSVRARQHFELNGYSAAALTGVVRELRVPRRPKLAPSSKVRSCACGRTRSRR
jgi:hypothetical protein